MTKKAVIIGYGKIGKKHLSILSTLKKDYNLDVSLAGVSKKKILQTSFDEVYNKYTDKIKTEVKYPWKENRKKQKETRRDLEDKLGYVPSVYLDSKKMLKKLHPDFAIICTSNESHLEDITNCVKEGIDFLCEKPLLHHSDNPKKVRKLLKMIKDKKINVGLNMQFYNPGQLLEGKKILFDTYTYEDIEKNAKSFNVTWYTGKKIIDSETKQTNEVSACDAIETIEDLFNHAISPAPPAPFFFNRNHFYVDDYLRGNETEVIIKFHNPDAEIRLGRKDPNDKMSTYRCWNLEDTETGYHKFETRWEKEPEDKEKTHHLAYYQNDQFIKSFQTKDPILVSQANFIQGNHPVKITNALRTQYLLSAIIQKHPVYNSVIKSLNEACNKKLFGADLFNKIAGDYWPMFNYTAKMALKDETIRRLYASNPEILSLAGAYLLPPDVEGVKQSLEEIYRLCQENKKAALIKDIKEKRQDNFKRSIVYLNTRTA